MTKRELTNHLILATVAWSAVAITGLWPAWPGLLEIHGRPVGFLELAELSGGTLAWVALGGLAAALWALHHAVGALDAAIDAWALRRGRGLGAFRVARFAVPAVVAVVAAGSFGWMAYHHLRTDWQGNYVAVIERHAAKAATAWARYEALAVAAGPPPGLQVPAGDPVPALRALAARPMADATYHVTPDGRMTLLDGRDVVRLDLRTMAAERRPEPLWPAFGPQNNVWTSRHDRAQAFRSLATDIRATQRHGWTREGGTLAWTAIDPGRSPSRLGLVERFHPVHGRLGLVVGDRFRHDLANGLLRELDFPGGWAFSPGAVGDAGYLLPARHRLPAAAPEPVLVMDGDLTEVEIWGHANRTVMLLAALAVAFGAAMLEAVRQFRALLAERALSMAQSAFVSGVSHEMRTPLATIKLYAELLDQGLDATPAQRAEFHGAILTEVDRLHRLIENVLDFARISGRKRAYAFVPTDLRAVLDEAVAAARGPLAAAGMACEVHMPAPITAAVDRDALVQAIANLVTNAAKYAPEGKRVWVSALPAPHGVTLAVQDFGAGIPPSERAKVFEPFYRMAGTAAGGTGLGLALVQEYVRAHGGRVELASEHGQGATFRLHLPLDPTAADAGKAAA